MKISDHLKREILIYDKFLTLFLRTFNA